MQPESNQSVKSQVRSMLFAGHSLTSCGAASAFITADLRKYVSVLKSEGVPIEFELIQNNNK